MPTRNCRPFCLTMTFSKTGSTFWNHGLDEWLSGGEKRRLALACFGDEKIFEAPVEIGRGRTT